MKTIIKNGTLIFADESLNCDLAMQNGKITAIGCNLRDEAAEEVDASGKLVLPGAIDLHTHLAMPFCGTCSADDYFSGTKAAACGGTTTVFDFAGQEAGESFSACIKRRDALAQTQACVDYAFHLGVTDIGGTLLGGMEECASMGVTSFKAYMTYDFSLDDGELLRLFQKSRECGTLVALHAENKEIIRTRIAEYLAQGKVDPWYHYLSRPEFVEEEAVSRAVQIACAAEAPLYIVHLSSKGSLETVTAARDKNLPLNAAE